MTNVLPFPTRPSAESVLDAAKAMDLEGVIILAWTRDGSEYMDSSIHDGADVLWLIRRLEHILMRACE